MTGRFHFEFGDIHDNLRRLFFEYVLRRNNLSLYGNIVFRKYTNKKVHTFYLISDPLIKKIDLCNNLELPFKITHKVMKWVDEQSMELINCTIIQKR